MFSLLGTLVFYDIIIIVCFLLCSRYEKTNHKFYKYCPYLILLLVSVFRYDIGADYENMYLGIHSLIKQPSELLSGSFIDENSRTPGLRILTILFQFFPNPELWVIGAYSVIFISSIYFVLNHYNAHKWGIPIIFLSFLIFQSWDWIKQSASMALIACSFVYIDTSKIRKATCCLLLAIFFHLSSIFAFPILFLNKIRFSSHLMSYILIGVFILAEMHFFDEVYNTLLIMTPFYGEQYSTSKQYAEMENYIFTSTSYIFFSIWSIFITYFSTKETQFYNILFFIGSILYMVSGGSLLIDRISTYYMMSQIVIFPMMMQYKKRANIIKIVFGLMILANFILVNRRFYEYGDIRGCVPYQTIFSDECDQKKFRIRD